MQFHVGGNVYKVRIAEQVTDGDGAPLPARAVAESRELLVSADVAPGDRLNVLLRALRQAWAFHFPRPRNDAEEGDLFSVMVAEALADFERQGGVAALRRLRGGHARRRRTASAADGDEAPAVLLKTLESIELAHHNLRLVEAALPAGAKAHRDVGAAAAGLDSVDQTLTSAYVAIAPGEAPRRDREVPGAGLPPRLDFPLWWRTDRRIRAGGFWVRKINGREYAFGPDPVTAEARFNVLCRRLGREDLIGRPARASDRAEASWRRSWAGAGVGLCMNGEMPVADGAAE